MKPYLLQIRKRLDRTKLRTQIGAAAVAVETIISEYYAI
jgi:hypothetical protein